MYLLYSRTASVSTVFCNYFWCSRVVSIHRFYITNVVYYLCTTRAKQDAVVIRRESNPYFNHGPQLDGLPDFGGIKGLL